VAFSADGVVAFTPAEVRHVRIRAGAQTLAFDRHRHGWTLAGRNDPVSAEIAAHLETAIRLLHVSAPAREISSDELTLASFSAFGLGSGCGARIR
jgi:hypothetical protein